MVGSRDPDHVAYPIRGAVHQSEKLVRGFRVGRELAAAKELVFTPGTTGLERLLDAGKPELSMEALMLRPEYRDLFTELELKEAARRLANAAPGRSRGRLQPQPTERK